MSRLAGHRRRGLMPRQAWSRRRCPRSRWSSLGWWRGIGARGRVRRRDRRGRSRWLCRRRARSWWLRRRRCGRRHRKRRRSRRGRRRSWWLRRRRSWWLRRRRSGSWRRPRTNRCTRRHLWLARRHYPRCRWRPVRLWRRNLTPWHRRRQPRRPEARLLLHALHWHRLNRPAHAGRDLFRLRTDEHPRPSSLSPLLEPTRVSEMAEVPTGDHERGDVGRKKDGLLHEGPAHVIAWRRVPIRSERCPADVSRAEAPVDPRRCPLRSRLPEPSKPRIQKPTSIMKRRPAPGVSAHPGPSHVGVYPSPVRIGHEVFTDLFDARLPGPAAARNLEPGPIGCELVIELRGLRRELGRRLVEDDSRGHIFLGVRPGQPRGREHNSEEPARRAQLRLLKKTNSSRSATIKRAGYYASRRP
jgi:hypothetical protein